MINWVRCILATETKVKCTQESVTNTHKMQLLFLCIVVLMSPPSSFAIEKCFTPSLWNSYLLKMQGIISSVWTMSLGWWLPSRRTCDTDLQVGYRTSTTAGWADCCMLKLTCCLVSYREAHSPSLSWLEWHRALKHRQQGKPLKHLAGRNSVWS